MKTMSSLRAGTVSSLVLGALVLRIGSVIIFRANQRVGPSKKVICVSSRKEK